MIQRFAQFWFLRKVSANSFSTTFYVWFFKKVFLMLYFINRSNLIVWLPLLLEILGNRSFAIVCFPGCDVINFEINLISLIKPFFYMTKKSRQKFKYLENVKKELLRWNKKQFSSFLKIFQLPYRGEKNRGKVTNFRR